MKAHTIIIVPILASTLVVAGCNQKSETADPVRPALSIVVEPTLPASAVAVGTVEPRYKTNLGFRVLGRIIARPVNVGDSVEQGQSVATLDATALELAVRSARAALSKSQAQLANASANDERKRKLLATDATTKATLDAADFARAGAEAAVARAQANLTKALEQLSYAELKTDFAGVVTKVDADVGQVVSPGQAVVTVARADIREAVVDLAPDFPVTLEVGVPFKVSLQLLPELQVEGEIREIAPQADPLTRTQRVRIALKNPPKEFRLGSTITAALSNFELSVLRVPGSAILTKNGDNFIWVIQPPANTVSLHRVDVARNDGGVIVKAGLEPGIRIVTAGIHSLKPGQQVRIKKDAGL
jgi:membrane fusion protein, multidrug efflux system